MNASDAVFAPGVESMLRESFIVYGVAELRGSSIRERTRGLIAVAHPKLRDELEPSGRELGYL